MSSQRHTAYVGLGGNLEEPAVRLRAALAAMDDWPHSRVTGRSSLYGSKPFGPVSQPDFVNAVARLATELAPMALLSALQELETALGRRRIQRWGPRHIDLDLLLYDELRIDGAQLQLPHPGIVERNFVLYPLLELEPELTVPGHGSVAELAARLDQAGLWRLENEHTHDG